MRGHAWISVVWLTVVWVLLWGDLSVANVLAGLAIALAVTAGLRMTRVEYHGRVHVVALVHLVARFLWDLVVASVQVSTLALALHRRPRGAVIGVQLRSHSDLYLTVTAQLCSLVPGALVIEAHRLTGMLYLHILDVEQSGGLEAVHRSVREQEERVLAALASDDELEAVGLGGLRRHRPHDRSRAIGR